ncbi:MAG TPA: heme-degrading domain-containing protein [Nocardioidaceae bacterium]|nr:heme-degrading domain-containing protein [Nocardioidaceae bacterium]
MGDDGRVWPPVAELAAQEQELRWRGFDEDDAWRLGTALVAAGRERRLPVAIDISRADHQLFHAALAGSSPDNDAWLARKARVVGRFHKSSLHVGQLCRDAGRTLEEMFLLPPGQYAAHGGAFPLTVVGVGVVGCVAVSGLPQLEDHALVVEVLRVVLGR